MKKNKVEHLKRSIYVMAQVVEQCGDKYLPIFERLKTKWALQQSTTC